MMAESHLTRRLFGAMLRRIWALPIFGGQNENPASCPTMRMLQLCRQGRRNLVLNR